MGQGGARKGTPHHGRDGAGRSEGRYTTSWEGWGREEQGKVHHIMGGMGQELRGEEGRRVQKREGTGGKERREEKRVKLEEGLKECPPF